MPSGGPGQPGGINQQQQHITAATTHQQQQHTTAATNKQIQQLQATASSLRQELRLARQQLRTTRLDHDDCLIAIQQLTAWRTEAFAEMHIIRRACFSPPTPAGRLRYEQAAAALREGVARLDSLQLERQQLEQTIGDLRATIQHKQAAINCTEQKIHSWLFVLIDSNSSSSSSNTSRGCSTTDLATSSTCTGPSHVQPQPLCMQQLPDQPVHSPSRSGPGSTPGLTPRHQQHRSPVPTATARASPQQHRPTQPPLAPASPASRVEHPSVPYPSVPYPSVPSPSVPLCSPVASPAGSPIQPPAARADWPTRSDWSTRANRSAAAEWSAPTDWSAASDWSASADPSPMPIDRPSAPATTAALPSLSTEQHSADTAAPALAKQPHCLSAHSPSHPSQLPTTLHLPHLPPVLSTEPTELHRLQPVPQLSTASTEPSTASTELHQLQPEHQSPPAHPSDLPLQMLPTQPHQQSQPVHRSTDTACTWPATNSAASTTVTATDRHGPDASLCSAYHLSGSPLHGIGLSACAILSVHLDSAAPTRPPPEPPDPPDLPPQSHWMPAGLCHSSRLAATPPVTHIAPLFCGDRSMKDLSSRGAVTSCNVSLIVH